MELPTVRDVVKRLEAEGYKMIRQKGSHIRYRRADRVVTVAGKPSEHLDRKTWESIRRQAGW